MKGNNTMLLNEATMIEAVQEYFDKRTTGFKLKVTSVKQDTSGYDATFKVQVTEPAEPTDG